MNIKVELEKEDDGRWIAEVSDLPGVMVYGKTRDEALTRVKALALRVLADRLENGETVPEMTNVFSVIA
ncbi:MAG: type II toxin-antitoxin system HicB family antitoxin [Candidatus Brocadiales bacterium]|nr:type II toxin-antitoxin system HicB family antitoxin [Candidatus Bathyanammoxibius sp.]